MSTQSVIQDFSLEQIVPFFQPIFDLNTGRVVRYECLARLVTKDDNVYLPSEFLHIITRSQSNALLTQRIFELSRAYCGPLNMCWSINMFQTDLRDQQLMAWIQDLFGHERKHAMGVELGFDSVKEHPHLLKSLMHKLPNLHVTVDDVNDCDPALFTIVETGIHAIKLRGEIVTNYTKTGQRKGTIEAIQACCHNAHCELIAEHVEDNNTLKAITTLGIKYGQGFYLSQPEAQICNLKQV